MRFMIFRCHAFPKNQEKEKRIVFMKNSQKIAAGVLAAVVVTSGAAALPVLQPENSSVSLTAAAANDAIAITDSTDVPDSIAQGGDIDVKGIVSSESSNLSSVTVGIYDSSRKLVTGKSALPKAKSYNISKLDEYVAFNKLAPGTYTYMVFATNGTNTNYVLTNKSFTVSAASSDAETDTAESSSSTMSISNGTSLPGGLKKGQWVTVKGTVTSADSNIASLTIGIYDENGKQLSGKTVEPNAKSYNVNKLDSAVSFDTLENGEYTYKITATNEARQEFVVVSQKFAVSVDGLKKPAETTTEKPTEQTTEESTELTTDAEGTTEATETNAEEKQIASAGTTTQNSTNQDAISIAEGTEVPDKLEKGKSVLVKGTVTSADSNLESLTVGIYDTSGKLVSGKTAIPNAKTYDVSKLDSYIEFDKLEDGTYAYMVFASNSVNKNFVMVNKAFTVGEGQVASDAIAIASGTTIPSTISKGESVAVKGTVASANSSLKSLTVGVYDADGKQVTGTTVEPNAKTYNLSKVDSQIAFDKLETGSYSYKVIASNEANKNYELVNQAFSVSDGTDLMTIANGTEMPDTLKKGSAVAVKGTVTSAKSDMTSVTVGVYDSEKKLVTGKSAVPNAKTYDVAKLDNYVEFDKLTDGNYTYMVFASNSANANYVIVNKEFTVGDATTVSNSSESSKSNKGVTLAGGTNIPETISKGSAVTVKGTVSAEDTIKAVTVAVYNSANKLVTSKSVAPNAKSYDLNKLDKYIEFNKLPAGAYTYRVAVTTTANKDVTADRQVFNVK